MTEPLTENKLARPRRPPRPTEGGDEEGAMMKASELVEHQAEQYRKIQDYERLAAENAKLREALQALDGYAFRNVVIHVLLQPERICIYSTLEGDPAQYIYYDSLDSAALA